METAFVIYFGLGFFLGVLITLFLCIAFFTQKKRLADDISSVLHPLKESLSLVDNKVAELERLRVGAYSSLTEQVESLLKSQYDLQKETRGLAQALSAPSIRGRWGEMQLKRCVELSGLSAHCDFVEQQTIKDGNDIFRPDLIVTLPKNKKIVVDAKVPLEAYLLSNHADDKSARSETLELASSIRRHLLSLNKKSYFKALGESPEFIVMFLPTESFLSRALTMDPLLIDFAAQHEVILATPATLIAILKAVAFSFRQDSIANNIEEVRKLSQQLIDRVAKVAEHFERLGKHLRQATESYNQTLASLDARVLVTARKLAEIKSVSLENELSALTPPLIDVVPQTVSFDKAEQNKEMA